MEKNYVKRAKDLLRGIISQRKKLLKKKKGYIEPGFAKTEFANIEYALPKIKTAKEMQAYIKRKEIVLRYLIPSTNKKRITELCQLIEAQLN